MRLPFIMPRQPPDSGEPLRVAFFAGSLIHGGAERQLVHMAAALRGKGADVRIYALTRGEHYEAVLSAMEMRPVWVGRRSSPPFRLGAMWRELRQFQPHVIQATHTFVNLYVGLLGRLLGTLSVGALRSSLEHCRMHNGRWTRGLIKLPHALIVNSQSVLEELERSRLTSANRVYHLPNAIDLSQFSVCHDDVRSDGARRDGRCAAVVVGRLVPVKCVERFIRALACARRNQPCLTGIIVGDGPERPRLEELASSLRLSPDNLKFLGQRDDIPEVLRRASMLVHCSNDEGLPNVMLEAMASGLPVIATPAGDAKIVVEEGVNGYLVEFDDCPAMAAKMVQLAGSAELRSRLGAAGRSRVAQCYDLRTLSDRLVSLYRRMAVNLRHERILRLLEQDPGMSTNRTAAVSGKKA